MVPLDYIKTHEPICIFNPKNIVLRLDKILQDQSHKLKKILQMNKNVKF